MEDEAAKEEEEEDTPPPLPSVPPPAPNWSTFPGGKPGAGSRETTDLSYLDASDLVPQVVREIYSLPVYQCLYPTLSFLKGI